MQGQAIGIDILVSVVFQQTLLNWLAAKLKWQDSNS